MPSSVLMTGKPQRHCFNQDNAKGFGAVIGGKHKELCGIEHHKLFGVGEIAQKGNAVI